MLRIYTILAIFMCSLILACTETSQKPNMLSKEDYNQEKKAILKTLDDETKAACARDYESWKMNWIPQSYISKTYINFADTSFSEMTGWEAVDDFVKTYIQEHPAPVTPPAQPQNMDVKVYGSGAWVSYEVNDEVFGRKRETRLMEKENGEWKIAGMHTTIYGFGE